MMRRLITGAALLVVVAGTASAQDPLTAAKRVTNKAAAATNAHIEAEQRPDAHSQAPAQQGAARDAHSATTARTPRGPVRTLSEAELVVQIDTLSAKFENRLLPKKPWTSGKMTAARLEALKKGIVGLSMRVEDVEGSFKLNQQKSEADYAAVANGLAAMPDHGSQTIAQLMRETRPQAFATTDFATTDKTASLEGSM